MRNPIPFRPPHRHTKVTTYALRENAKWHDGAPLTAHDYAFAYAVYTDPDIAVAKRSPENLMAGVEAKDDYTLVIRWKESYYAAGSLRYQMLDPLPRLVRRLLPPRRRNAPSRPSARRGATSTGPISSARARSRSPAAS